MGSVLRRLLFFFQRNQFDRDLEDELRFHEEMKARVLADAHGMSDDEARAAARRRIGNPLRLREQSREPWIFATVETFAQDVRHALRLMRRDPAFTFTTLATLALGIGLNTAIFSVAYGVLWRPLPYPNADRLVLITAVQQTETGVRTLSTWAPVTYEALRPRVTALDLLAAYSPIDAQLSGRGEPLQVRALDVSPNFFATLGVTPARGRAFLTGAAAPDDDGTAIVSNRLWRTSLNADPAIVGQSITIDGLPRTVVGVLPPDFSFRPVVRIGALPEADIFLPNRWPGDTGRSAFLFLLGRMKSGVTQERAEAELTALVNDSSIAPAGALAPAGAFAPNVRTLARAVGLQEYGTESVRTLLLILLGAVSFVLLIACVNVANLQLARLTARRGELSVRMALGAGRRRIVRQLLTEAVVLSLLGALLGLLLAWLAIGAALPLVPEGVLSRPGGIVIDARVLAFCLGLSLLASVLVGLVPAVRISGSAVGEGRALHGGDARTTGDRQGEQLRTLLVAAQIAMTLVLLIGAGLLIHSFVRLTSVSPGFESSGRDGVVQTVRVTLPERLYDEPERIHAFARGVLDRRVDARDVPQEHQEAEGEVLHEEGDHHARVVVGQPGGLRETGRQQHLVQPSLRPVEAVDPLGHQDSPEGDGEDEHRGHRPLEPDASPHRVGDGHREHEFRLRGEGIGHKPFAGEFLEERWSQEDRREGRRGERRGPQSTRPQAEARGGGKRYVDRQRDLGGREGAYRQANHD